MTREPWQPPKPSPEASLESSPLNRYRAFAAFGFCAASFLEGVLESAGGEPSKRVAAAFAMASSATMWCMVDASSRGGYYPHSLRWVTVFTWPIAVPVYLIQSRKGQGALLALFCLVALVATQVMGSLIGTLVFGSR